jgi:uncharacterized protein YndB with AHSA1/START domain
MALSYSNTLILKLPVQRAYELMSDHALMQHWMPGLTGIEQVDGTAGQAGSKAILRFQMGKRLMSMEERVLEADGLSRMVVEYHSPMALNRVTKYLHPLEGGDTEYTMENQFTFRGVMRLIGPFMKGTFQKTSRGYMERFKAFVESAP